MVLFFYRFNLLNKVLIPKLCRRLCSKVNSFTWRTHTCGELRVEHVGKEVVLCGWLTAQRCDKFILLRDTYGSVQIYFDEHDIANAKFSLSLPAESVIQVTGVPRKRPTNKINKNISTGEIEVVAKEVKLLNSSVSKLPFGIKHLEKLLDTTKLKYRYLSLRDNRIQEILKARGEFVSKVRDFLYKEHGFLEIETPTLFRKTPGGAKEFIVPTKFPGRCYSLVQSPQQFKQLLMIGGLDRYFQIARCYRNEGTKTDRQPEFTQIDIEASFVSANNVRELVEQMLLYSWPLTNHKIETPFPVITYNDALKYYGTDKPDTRYEVKIEDITHFLLNENIDIFNKAIVEGNVICAIALPAGSNHIKKLGIKELKGKAQEFLLENVIEISIKSDLSWKSFLAKHISENVQTQINRTLKVVPNDLILITSGPEENVRTFLGKIRNECVHILDSAGIEVYKSDFSFVWVIDFPLFLKAKNGTLEAAHHPFTAPKFEDIDLVYTESEKAKSLHYDLVLNGQEIAGGSIRIHDLNLQTYILEEILKEDSTNLRHLLDALSYGCPPHGGIALGLDRLLAIMFNCRSISEVIAFPKSLDGKDLMSGAPAPITEEDQLLYHIVPKISKISDNEQDFVTNDEDDDNKKTIISI